MRLAEFKHHVTYATKLSAGDIYDRLLAVTAPYDTFTSTLNFEYDNRKYQGDIASEGFVLLQKGSRSVAWAPEIRGRYEFGDTQSLVYLQLSPHPIGIMLGVVLPIFFLLPLSIHSINLEMQKPVFDMSILWFLAFAVLFPVGVIARYLYNVYDMKHHLKILLEAEEVIP